MILKKSTCFPSILLFIMDKMGKSLGKLQEIYGDYGKIIGNYAFDIRKSQNYRTFFGGDHSGQSLGHKMGTCLMIFI